MAYGETFFSGSRKLFRGYASTLMPEEPFLTRFLHYFRFISVVYIIPICYNAENKNRLLFSHEWICWPSRKGGREALTYLLVSGRENKTAEGRKRFSGGLILFYIIEKKRKKSALPDLADPGRGGFGR